MKKITSRWLQGFIALVATITFCYFYVDKNVAYFFQAHSFKEYTILKLIAEIPGTLLGVVPALFVYLIIRHSWSKPNAIDQAFFILIVASSTAFVVRELLKVVFSRPWIDTFYNNNPSLLRNNVYGFKWFDYSYLYKSFPSGHMINILCVAVVLNLLYPRLKYIWSGIAFSVALAQMSLNYHFISDIIAGSYIGALVGYYTTYMVRSHHIFEPKA
jgi:membrane-associated phospholipid phosphatase